MDLPRYWRTLEVARIRRIEDLRTQYVNGKIGGQALAPDDWAAIIEHDRILGE